MNTSGQVDVSQLLQMTRPELDRLFAQSPCGPIPDGRAEGTALIAPGTPYAAPTAHWIRLFAWQGKTFYADRGILTNRITPLGLCDVVAMVYQDASRYDGKDCIVLDYSKTSIPARFIRDEIREIASGLYLGRVYVAGFFVFGFCLQF